MASGDPAALIPLLSGTLTAIVTTKTAEIENERGHDPGQHRPLGVSEMKDHG